MVAACYNHPMSVNRASGACMLLFLLPTAPFLHGQGVPSSLASAESGSQTLREFEEKYQNAARLQATFLERYRENGRVVRVEGGDAYFLRPGKMRWDYQAPEKNTFLVDGKYVWFYSPVDHTVTRMPAKQSEDWRTPLAFLTSHMKLSRLCSKISLAQDEKPAQADGVVYRCLLRGAPESDASASKAVLLELSPQAELNRIVIPQEGGIELEFSFAAWRWNPVLDKSIFQFTPPRDVVIVNGLLPDAPGLRQ
jgi:outer membrane lipoprotein carrier protein